MLLPRTHWGDFVSFRFVFVLAFCVCLSRAEDDSVGPADRRGGGGGGRAGGDEGETPPGAEGLERYASRESEGERVAAVAVAAAVSGNGKGAVAVNVTKTGTGTTSVVMVRHYSGGP